MKRCVVCYGRGGWYPQGLARLRGQCAKFGVDFLGFDGDTPCGFAPHEMIPYAFKPACVQAAIERGYETVCWMDSSANIQHDPSPIFEIAERDGACVMQNYGIRTGTWSTDACLDYFGINRKTAWSIEHCSALVCAFCPSHPVGATVWEEYSRAARDGRPFVGPHKASAAPHLFSKWDPSGVEGHRHDQTVLSILAWKYGIPLQENRVFMDYGRDRPDAIVAAYPV